MKNRVQQIVITQKAFYLKALGKLFCMLLVAAEMAMADERNAVTQVQPPLFKMWLGAGLPKMQSYDQAIVESALENSKEKYGEYRLITEVATNTIKRQERIFNASSEVSINVTPMNSLYNDRAEGGYLMVPFPIAKGMLGYRQLLVNKNRLEEFRRVKSLKDLQHYSIGQVMGWADVQILQDNNIDVYAVPKYELLFPMLNSNRFDSISVGCTEVPALMKFLETNYPDKFLLVPDLVLFYPFSLFIFVNKDQQNALERLTYGYEWAQRKGEADKLFDSYHGALFKALKTPDLKIIQLKNNQISARGADVKPGLLE